MGVSRQSSAGAPWCGPATARSGWAPLPSPFPGSLASTAPFRWKCAGWLTRPVEHLSLIHI
eukprot:3967528-Pyramimonas_sp.AAC.1